MYSCNIVNKHLVSFEKIYTEVNHLRQNLVAAAELCRTTISTVLNTERLYDNRHQQLEDSLAVKTTYPILEL